MTTPENILRVTPADADHLATSGAGVLDVREPEVRAVGHLPGAVA